MKDIYINTAFPPTVNSYYVKTRNGVFISKRGKLFREGCARDAMESSTYGIKLSCPLQLDVILYPPDRRIRDLDNYMKALLDALTHAKVWMDDSLIDGLNIHRGKVIKGGAASLRIAEHNGFILPNDPDVWNFID